VAEGSGRRPRTSSDPVAAGITRSTRWLPAGRRPGRRPARPVARDARVCAPGRDRGGHLQVPSHLRVVSRQLARVDAVTGELVIEQPPRRGARLRFTTRRPARCRSAIPAASSAALAEFIRELIVEGTHEGLDAARGRGVRLGRPPAMTAEQIRHARDLLTRPDNTVSSIARLLGVSRATIYKYVPEVTTACAAATLPPGQQKGLTCGVTVRRLT